MASYRMNKKPNELTIEEAARALRARELTVRELWDACASIARERNPELNAFLEIFDADDAAIAAAQKQIGDREDLSRRVDRDGKRNHKQKALHKIGGQRFHA